MTVKQAFQEFDLVSIIKKMFGGALPRYERGNRPRDRIYASELGDCQRAVWLNWRHPRPHDEAFERGRGALGHAVEHMLAEQLAPLIVAREVSFTNDIISGRADFFLRLPTGEQIPLELKSTYGFQRAMAEPKPSHVLQLQYYAMASDAPFGLLAYLDLSNYGGNSGVWKTLRIPRNDEGVMKRAKYLRKLVEHGVEPTCEHAGDPDGCWDCDRAEGKV